MKIISNPQSGKCGNLVYVNSQYGQVVRPCIIPRNRRTEFQQENRGCFAAAVRHFQGLNDEQCAAWEIAAARQFIVTRTGRRVPRTGYRYCVGTNTQQATLGLPMFDLPPAPAAFSPNPVGDLAITNVNGDITIKLPVLGALAQYTLLQGAKPVRSSTRCVQHFPHLGLLPPPIDGWSYITGLYVARYGMPQAGQRIFIRTSQYIGGWSDIPKLTSARIPDPTS